jgi:hypothetical protein
VCRLAVVPVRVDPHHAGEQATQLLFGDHYEVLDTSSDKRWLQVRVYSDQADGWIDSRQHHAISEEYFQQINKTDYKITTDIASPVLYKKMPLTIVMGSIVPISSSELFKIEEQFAFNGESKGLGQKRDGEFVRLMARKYLSAPFQWGGKSPFGIDASALVQMVFKIAGYQLPRHILGLAVQGKPISSLDHARLGDIAFFSVKGNAPIHCGILTGDEHIIHAHGLVRSDLINEEGILAADTKIYSHHLHSIRRVLF